MAEEYPVEPMADVEPIFVRQMILGAMACQYVRRVPNLSYEEGLDAARATWGTDWKIDPAPRTFIAAIEEVDEDLEHWESE